MSKKEEITYGRKKKERYKEREERTTVSEQIIYHILDIERKGWDSKERGQQDW